MPNEVKPTTTPVTAASSTQGQQPASSQPKQSKPTSTPSSTPVASNSRDDAVNAGSKKTRDEAKPLELAVEQNAS